MNDENKDIERILEDVRVDDAPDRRHQDMLEQRLLLGYDATPFRREKSWRLIMSRNMPKFAAAAVIVIGVLVAVAVFHGAEGVSWAQVRDRVAGIRAVVYEAELARSGETMRIEAVQSDEYGTRMDMYMGGAWVSRCAMLAAKNSYIILMPDRKKYIEVELTDEIRLKNGDPKVMVESFLSGDYKELGRSEIDGVVVEGVETRDVSPTAGLPGGEWLFEGQSEWQFPGEVVARLWVDVDSGWPVQVTVDVTTEDAEVMSLVVSDFQWDAQVDAEAFASVIPPDYTLMYTITKSTPESGGQLVAGLAYFAKLSGGKYPAKLTIGDIFGEVGPLVDKLSREDSSFRFDDVQMSNLKYGVQHFRQLEVDGKEPVYNGDSVRANDAGKVLVRWKLEGDLYRVVFGDLRIEEVTAERLAELEGK